MIGLSFLKWGKSAYDVCYRTERSVPECILRILAQPWTYQDPRYCAQLTYRCQLISETYFHISFTGNQYRKTVRMVYLAEFISASEDTLVQLSYQQMCWEAARPCQRTWINSYTKKSAPTELQKS